MYSIPTNNTSLESVAVMVVGNNGAAGLDSGLVGGVAIMETLASTLATDPNFPAKINTVTI